MISPPSFPSIQKSSADVSPPNEVSEGFEVAPSVTINADPQLEDNDASQLSAMISLSKYYFVREIFLNQIRYLESQETMWFEKDLDTYSP